MFASRSVSGVTLIELMLAMVLSTLIISAIIEIYLSEESGMNTQIALTEIEENTRMANQFLSSEIHSAGFLGCAKLSATFLLHNHLAIAITQNNKITSYQTQLGDDAIRVWHASSKAASIAINNKASVLVSQAVTFHVGDRVLISDCQKAEITQIKSLHPVKNHLQKMVLQVPLDFDYEPNAEVSVFEVNQFFIADTKRRDAHNKSIHALYWQKYQGHPQELVEGVEHMTIRFALLQTDGLTEYPAREVKDTANLVGVSFKLQLHSVSTVSLEKSDYAYAALRQ